MATPREFETEEALIPALKSELVGADDTMQKWTVTGDEKGRTLTIVAKRPSAIQDPLPLNDGDEE